MRGVAMNKESSSLFKYYVKKLQVDFIIIFLAIAVAFAVSGIFIEILGANFLSAFYAMLHGVFGRIYGIGEVLVKATPLILVALGVAIGFKGGLTNLGGDGQFYMGALAAVWVGITFQGIPSALHLALIIAAAAFAGAIWGGVAGFLKARLNSNEVIMTIMMNYIATYFVSFLVHGPLKEPGGYIPQTKQIAKALHLFPIIPRTRAHYGIVIALIAVVLVYVILSKTIWGYRIKAVGLAPKASIYAGINTGIYTTVTLALSGAFAGIAGMVEVYGIHFRLLDGISPGFGFTAIVVALLGKLNPFGIVLASLFIGILTVGANSMQVTMEVPVSIVYITESLVILFMLLGYGIKLELWQMLTQKVSLKSLFDSRRKQVV